MVCRWYFKSLEGVWCRCFSFDEYNLAFFGLAQLFWLLYPKFGRFFPNLLVTLELTHFSCWMGELPVLLRLRLASCLPCLGWVGPSTEESTIIQFNQPLKHGQCAPSLHHFLFTSGITYLSLYKHWILRSFYTIILWNKIAWLVLSIGGNYTES